MTTRMWTVLVAFAAAVVASAPTGEAHKGITSKYTYNVEVRPIFANRCGRCHVDGGVGPMSLMTYEDAFPWAESLRTELLSAYADGSAEQDAAKDGATDAMKPSGDPDAFVKAAHRQIPARELDIILDWATGGTPQGEVTGQSEPPAMRQEWAAGQPHLVAAMPEPFTVPADAWETTHEFVVPLSVSGPRTAARFDVLPGTAAIVRSVAVSIRAADGSIRAVGTWFPRQHPQPIAIKPEIRVEPASHLVARIRYKKTWKYEGTPLTDRSSVGLYFTD